MCGSDEGDGEVSGGGLENFSGSRIILDEYIMKSNNMQMLRSLRCGLAMCLACFCFESDAQVNFGSPEKFDEGWLFQLGDDADSYMAEYAEYT